MTEEVKNIDSGNSVQGTHPTETKEFDFYLAYARLPAEAIGELVSELNMEIGIPSLSEEELMLKLHHLMDRKYFQYKPEVNSEQG